MAQTALKADVFNGSCPSRGMLELIGGKWSMLILCVLRTGPQRTLALKRRIDGISQKMLTQTLRDLERHGLIQRIDYQEVPPHVEYRLTRLGDSLSELVDQIETWVVKHYVRMRQLAEEHETRA